MVVPVWSTCCIGSFVGSTFFLYPLAFPRKCKNNPPSSPITTKKHPPPCFVLKFLWNSSDLPGLVPPVLPPIGTTALTDRLSLSLGGLVHRFILQSIRAPEVDYVVNCDSGKFVHVDRLYCMFYRSFIIYA